MKPKSKIKNLNQGTLHEKSFKLLLEVNLIFENSAKMNSVSLTESDPNSIHPVSSCSHQHSLWKTGCNDLTDHPSISRVEEDFGKMKSSQIHFNSKKSFDNLCLNNCNAICLNETEKSSSNDSSNLKQGQSFSFKRFLKKLNKKDPPNSKESTISFKKIPFLKKCLQNVSKSKNEPNHNRPETKMSLNCDSNKSNQPFNSPEYTKESKERQFTFTNLSNKYSHCYSSSCLPSGYLLEQSIHSGRDTRPRSLSALKYSEHKKSNSFYDLRALVENIFDYEILRFMNSALESVFEYFAGEFIVGGDIEDNRMLSGRPESFRNSIDKFSNDNYLSIDRRVSKLTKINNSKRSGDELSEKNIFHISEIRSNKRNDPSNMTELKRHSIKYCTIKTSETDESNSSSSEQLNLKKKFSKSSSTGRLIYPFKISDNKRSRMKTKRKFSVVEKIDTFNPTKSKNRFALKPRRKDFYNCSDSEDSFDTFKSSWRSDKSRNYDHSPKSKSKYRFVKRSADRLPVSDNFKTKSKRSSVNKGDYLSQARCKSTSSKQRNVKFSKLNSQSHYSNSSDESPNNSRAYKTKSRTGTDPNSKICHYRLRLINKLSVPQYSKARSKSSYSKQRSDRFSLDYLTSSSYSYNSSNNERVSNTKSKHMPRTDMNSKISNSKGSTKKLSVPGYSKTRSNSQRSAQMSRNRSMSSRSSSDKSSCDGRLTQAWSKNLSGTDMSFKISNSKISNSKGSTNKLSVPGYSKTRSNSQRSAQMSRNRSMSSRTSSDKSSCDGRLTQTGSKNLSGTDMSFKISNSKGSTNKLAVPGYSKTKSKSQTSAQMSRNRSMSSRSSYDKSPSGYVSQTIPDGNVNKLFTTEGSRPESKPESTPGSKSGSTPGSKPGSRSRSKSGSKSGSKPRSLATWENLKSFLCLDKRSENQYSSSTTNPKKSSDKEIKILTPDKASHYSDKSVTSALSVSTLNKISSISQIGSTTSKSNSPNKVSNFGGKIPESPYVPEKNETKLKKSSANSWKYPGDIDYSETNQGRGNTIYKIFDYSHIQSRYLNPIGSHNPSNVFLKHLGVWVKPHHAPCFSDPYYTIKFDRATGKVKVNKILSPIDIIRDIRIRAKKRFVNNGSNQSRNQDVMSFYRVKKAKKPNSKFNNKRLTLSKMNPFQKRINAKTPSKSTQEHLIHSKRQSFSTTINGAHLRNPYAPKMNESELCIQTDLEMPSTKNIQCLEVEKADTDVQYASLSSKPRHFPEHMSSLNSCEKISETSFKNFNTNINTRWTKREIGFLAPCHANNEDMTIKSHWRFNECSAYNSELSNSHDNRLVSSHGYPKVPPREEIVSGYIYETVVDARFENPPNSFCSNSSQEEMTKEKFKYETTKDILNELFEKMISLN